MRNPLTVVQAESGKSNEDRAAGKPNTREDGRG